MSSRSGALRLLFSALRNAGYEWQPQTPDRLLSFRKDPSPFRPLVQFFGLGLAVSPDELLLDGLVEPTIEALQKCGFIENAGSGSQFKSSMAVSGAGDVFVIHDHWPPDPNQSRGYVHFAAESAWLARAMARDLEGFIGKRVLDLGCSSGALLFEVAAVADEVLGIDISERAIEWGRETAAALGFRGFHLEVATIGQKSAELAVGTKPWDIVVMNPPMVVPAKDAAYSHRDGGKLGIELPLLFLDFAAQHLQGGGEVLTFVTNPIIGGRSVFFERLRKSDWDFIERRCLHSHFNQSVARKQGYSDQGIERIELWFLHMKKLTNSQ